MKKTFLAIATAVACMIGFTACDDPAALERLVEQTDLAGHMTLTTSNANGVQAYASGDTLSFKSAIANVKFDTIYLDDHITITDIDAGTLIVGTRDNLITADSADLQPPYLGINLRDTTTGTYQIACPIDNIEFFRYLSTQSVALLICSGITFEDNIGNLFAIACDEEHYYIGTSGTITVTDFGAAGGQVKASVNVNAIYVTDSQIEAIANGQMEATNLPTITFSGEVSSRRANIEAVVNALNEAE